MQLNKTKRFSVYDCISGQAAGSSMGGGGAGEDEAIARAKAKAEAIEASRAYQATRLYSTPPVYGEHDERRETGNYGLTHMATTITIRRCFAAIIRYLMPCEAARVLQARKMFRSAVEAAEEQIVRHLHTQHFSLVPFPSTAMLGAAEAVGGGAVGGGAVGGGGGGGGMCNSWTRYLHELATNKSHKLLIMGGRDEVGVKVKNRVDMMVIDDKDTKISWQSCAPMIKNRCYHSAYYCQGQVLSISSENDASAKGQVTSALRRAFANSSRARTQATNTKST